MYQQTYCLTLPKPFFKIFLFRIYAPTIHSTDIDFDETSVSGLHTSPRQSSHHKPIHQRHTQPHPTNTHARTASTNTHRHTRRRAGPTLTQSMHSTLTPMHRRSDPPQAGLQSGLQAGHALAAPMQSQPRCTRSHAPVRNWTGQADRIRLNQTRPD